MATVYIGIGSNLGDRKQNCRKAVALMLEHGIKVVKISSMIETAPWGVRDQPSFINMAAKAATSLEPGRLLSVLKGIEDEMGRMPDIRWGPRIIDLDILLYDDRVLTTPDLEIPHPQMHERDFVLKPLAEIAPDAVHPVLKKSISTLLDEKQSMG